MARELGYTPIYLHYNSGLSVSTNGRILAQLMERLYDAWPVPIERLVMFGHSMGGLVARSAIHHGALIQRGGLRWPARVDDLVTLGTPHQGAALERAGHGVDLLLSAAPYAAPLARLSQLRSAGINDLRLGNILSSPGGDHGAPRGPQVDLPAKTRGFAVAGEPGRAPATPKANCSVMVWCRWPAHWVSPCTARSPPGDRTRAPGGGARHRPPRPVVERRSVWPAAAMAGLTHTGGSVSVPSTSEGA